MPADPVPQLVRYGLEGFGFLLWNLLDHWRHLEVSAQDALQTWSQVDAERLPAAVLAAMLSSHQQQLAAQNQMNEALARTIGQLLEPGAEEQERAAAIKAWWEGRVVTD